MVEIGVEYDSLEIGENSVKIEQTLGMSEESATSRIEHFVFRQAGVHVPSRGSELGGWPCVWPNNIVRDFGKLLPCVRYLEEKPPSQSQTFELATPSPRARSVQSRSAHIILLLSASRILAGCNADKEKGEIIDHWSSIEKRSGYEVETLYFSRMARDDCGAHDTLVFEKNDLQYSL